jgi:hypothetical protein
VAGLLDSTSRKRVGSSILTGQSFLNKNEWTFLVDVKVILKFMQIIKNIKMTSV